MRAPLRPRPPLGASPRTRARIRLRKFPRSFSCITRRTPAQAAPRPGRHPHGGVPSHSPAPAGAFAEGRTLPHPNGDPPVARGAARPRTVWPVHPSSPPRIAQSLEPPTPTWCTDARRPHRTPPLEPGNRAAARHTLRAAHPECRHRATRAPAADAPAVPTPTRAQPKRPSPPDPHTQLPARPSRPIRSWPPPRTALPPHVQARKRTRPLLSTPTPNQTHPPPTPAAPRACVPRRSPPSPRDPRPRPYGPHSLCTPARPHAPAQHSPGVPHTARGLRGPPRSPWPPRKVGGVCHERGVRWALACGRPFRQTRPTGAGCGARAQRVQRGGGGPRTAPREWGGHPAGRGWGRHVSARGGVKSLLGASAAMRDICRPGGTQRKGKGLPRAQWTACGRPPTTWYREGGPPARATLAAPLPRERDVEVCAREARARARELWPNAAPPMRVALPRSDAWRRAPRGTALALALLTPRRTGARRGGSASAASRTARRRACERVRQPSLLARAPSPTGSRSTRIEQGKRKRGATVAARGAAFCTHKPWTRGGRVRGQRWGRANAGPSDSRASRQKVRARDAWGVRIRMRPPRARGDAGLPPRARRNNPLEVRAACTSRRSPRAGLPAVSPQRAAPSMKRAGPRSRGARAGRAVGAAARGMRAARTRTVRRHAAAGEEGIWMRARARSVALSAASAQHFTEPNSDEMRPSYGPWKSRMRGEARHAQVVAPPHIMLITHHHHDARAPASSSPAASFPRVIMRPPRHLIGDSILNHR